MSEQIVIETGDSPPDSPDETAAEHATETAIDATIDAAVNAALAEREADDAEQAATVAESAASISTNAADSAHVAASVAAEAADVAERTLNHVYELVESIPERVALSLQAMLTPPTEEEQTIDEVVTEALVPEVAPRGQHMWFANKLWGR